MTVSFESMHIDVAWPTVNKTVSYPVDADIIVIVGFFASPDPIGSLIPVASLENGIASCEGLDQFNRPTSNTAKALIAAWEAGGRHVALYRAGDPTVLENVTDEVRLARIYDAYEAAYLELREYSFISYLYPADVNFEDTVPNTVTTPQPHVGAGGFGAQLAMHCAGFKTPYVDSIVQGVMSSASDDPIATMLSAAMTAKFNYQKTNCKIDSNASPGGVIWFPEADPFRYLSVAGSRAMIYSPRTTASFEFGLGATLVGLESSLPDDIASTGRRVNNINLKHVPSRSEADALSKHGIVPFGLTVDSRRGRSAEIVVLSDNNLAMPVSDFQQNQTLRFIRRITGRLVRLCEPYIGTPGVGIEQTVENFLSSLKKKDLIKSYDWKYARDAVDPQKLNLLIEVEPYFSTKVISITTSVGPIYL